MNKFYTLEKVNERITSILDPSGVRSYLVIGDKEAALIDTGCGIGSLKSVVSELTDKPLTVLCTHGHVDHAGGAYEFEKVYLSKLDFECVKEHTTIERRMWYAEGCGYKADRNDMLPQRDGNYTDLPDGMTFPLGGVTLEAVHVPGHTPGMTCILFKEMRILLTGDGCNPFVFLFLPESSSVEDYKKALINLKKRENEFDRVFVSHGRFEEPKIMIDTCIETCDDILSGKSEKVPFESLGRKALIAHAMGTAGRMDCKVGNIVYRCED